MKNCCEILEVSNSATIEEIEAAYRLRVRKCHPDLGGNAEEFKVVTSAYESLKKTSICEACDGKGQKELLIRPFSFIVPCCFCNGKGRKI